VICLSPPSLDLAKRILTDVGWENRIEGFFDAPLRGRLREFLFKFEDATRLLRAEVFDPWSARSGLFGYFDFQELQAWIRNVFADTELADAIERATAENTSLKEQIDEIRLWMELRQQQCKDKIRDTAVRG
jgi:hypothetical protein